MKLVCARLGHHVNNAATCAAIFRGEVTAGYAEFLNGIQWNRLPDLAGVKIYVLSAIEQGRTIYYRRAVKERQ